MIRPPIQRQSEITSTSPSSATLSTLLSPSIFLPILSHCPPSTLATCLRVSQAISHRAGSILYRSIHLVDVLPPAIPSPPFSPSPTLIPFLGYVRTLKMPGHQLYNPALCAAVVQYMHRLERVVVPGDWEGWVIPPKSDQPVFPEAAVDEIVEKKKSIQVFITGLRSPAAVISRGILQSRLLDRAQEVVLVLDHIHPVHQGPRQSVTATMAGPRYSTDLPTTIKRLTIILPPRNDQPQPTRRAAFDPVADSPFFSIPFGPFTSMIDTSTSASPRSWEMTALDPATDLARVVAGRGTTMDVTMVLRISRINAAKDDLSSAEVSLRKLQERIERLVQGLLGEQGGEDATAAERIPVKWVLEKNWEGLTELQGILG